MAKRIKYRLNRAKRKELEVLKKLSGTQEESRQLTYKLKLTQDQLERSQRLQADMDREVKKLNGYTVIRIGLEPHYPGKVIGCSVMIRVDELLHGILGSRGLINIESTIQYQSQAMAREISAGIMGYLKQEGLL